MCFRGRFHSYEGHDMKTVVLPVYVMRCLGVRICVVTNAAGGLNPDYRVGDVVAVSDHLGNWKFSILAQSNGRSL